MIGFNTVAFLIIGFVFGNWLRGSLTRRWINGRHFQAEVEKQLHVAFRAGFLTAADILTMEGHEDLAGKLRHAASAVKAANDNN